MYDEYILVDGSFVFLKWTFRRTLHSEALFIKKAAMETAAEAVADRIQLVILVCALHQHGLENSVFFFLYSDIIKQAFGSYKLDFTGIKQANRNGYLIFCDDRIEDRIFCRSASC